MPERWYLSRSKPCKEYLLCGQLRIRKIEAYHPRIGMRPAIIRGIFSGCKAVLDMNMSGVERVGAFLKRLQAKQKRLKLPAGQIKKIKAVEHNLL